MTEETRNRLATDELMALLIKEEPKACCDDTIITAIRAIAFRTPRRPVFAPVIGAQCSNCTSKIDAFQNFCSNCGLAIEWDD